MTQHATYFGPARACAALLILALSAPLARSDDAGSADNLYLDGLKGDWVMSGTLLGKPVKYNARGERVLHGGFLRLHMIDVAKEPTYEADFFIGFDARANDYIGHWLDLFGAAGARVVGTGKRNGDTLIMAFPYKEGAFKDTLVFDPKAHAWSLLIESQAAGGAWSNFATYSITRAVHKNVD